MPYGQRIVGKVSENYGGDVYLFAFKMVRTEGTT